jgi:hypothetical protein
MPKIAKKPITLILDLVVSGTATPAAPLVVPNTVMAHSSATIILLRTNKIAKRAPPSRVSTSALGRNLKKRHKLNFLPTVVLVILIVSIFGGYLSTMFEHLMPILVNTRSRVKLPLCSYFGPVFGTMGHAMATPIHAAMFPIKRHVKLPPTFSLDYANGCCLQLHQQGTAPSMVASPTVSMSLMPHGPQGGSQPCYQTFVKKSTNTM